MKKMLFGFLLLCLAVGFVSAQNAIIKDFVGTVEVKAPGAAAWTAATRGQTLARNAMISTSFKSTATLTVGNSTLIVHPLTRMTIEEFTQSQGDERVALNLQTGRIRAEVTPPAEGRTAFTVKAPAATASVRGTSFDFDGVNLSVDQGRVQVVGSNGTPVYVAAGNTVTTDSESGRTQTAAEAFVESLTPNAPVGVSSGRTQTAAEAFAESLTPNAPVGVNEEGADSGSGSGLGSVTIPGISDWRW